MIFMNKNFYKLTLLGSVTILHKFGITSPNKLFEVRRLTICKPDFT